METPKYCKNCKSFDTWKWNPAGDVYGEPDTGQDVKITDGTTTITAQRIMWRSYICTVCGNKTLRKIR